MKPPWPSGRRLERSILVVLGVFLLGGIVAGCASGMSAAARGQVTYAGSFPALQGAPESHRGQVAMLGGRIIETTPRRQGTEIIVLQLPLSASDKPLLEEPSEGRFLIAAPEFLDPAAYPKLTPITVVGEITGHVERTIGDYPYTLPVMRPIEIKVWSARNWGGRSPGVHVGVGAGSHGGGAGFGISF